MHHPPLPTLRRTAAALWLCAALGAHAQSDPPPADTELSALRLSGFATIGSSYTDMAAPWAFRRDVLQRSTGSGRVNHTVDSRIGLQAHLTFSDDWEGVVQGVLKPLADHAPDAQRFEWAFVSWRPGPNTVARVGRVSTDTYLASQYSNVGFAYPWVRPNMEFYGWTSLQAIDGLDVSQTWQQGARRWRFKALAGQTNLAVPSGPGERLSFHGRDMLGASVSAEEGGFTGKLSHIRIKFSFQASTSLDPLIAGLRGVEASPVIPTNIRDEARTLRESTPYGEISSHYTAISLQYLRGPWLAQGELSRSAGGPDSNHLTGSLAYRRGTFTFFGTGGRARPRDNPAVTPNWTATLAANPFIGPVGAAQLQYLGATAAMVSNTSRVEQRSVGAGLRWDFHDQAAFKLQLDRFKVAPFGGALWMGNNFEARRANVLSAVIDTVF